MPVESFGTPDEAGFEALLADPVVEYRGMAFLQSQFRQADVDASLETIAADQVQRQVNHTHLLLYVEDVDIQRKWAYQLVDRWRQHAMVLELKRQFVTRIDDSGREVIATFWAE